MQRGGRVVVVVVVVAVVNAEPEPEPDASEPEPELDVFESEPKPEPEPEAAVAGATPTYCPAPQTSLCKVLLSTLAGAQYAGRGKPLCTMASQLPAMAA